MTKQTGREQRSGIDLINICKYGMVLVLLIYIGFLLAGDKDSKVPFDTVKSKVVKAADISAMEEADGNAVRKYYGINPKEYEGVTLYISKEAMGVDELLLVQMKDESQSEALNSAIEERISQQLNNFDGYGAAQTKLLENAVVEQQGRYMLVSISANASKVQNAFLKAL